MWGRQVYSTFLPKAKIAPFSRDTLLSTTLCAWLSSTPLPKNPFSYKILQLMSTSDIVVSTK